MLPFSLRSLWASCSGAAGRAAEPSRIVLMALALLYLIVALVVFVGATVVAVAVMLRVQAKRGDTRKTKVDEATVAMLRRRRQRLDRRLGIDPDTDPEAQPPSETGPGGEH